MTKSDQLNRILQDSGFSRYYDNDLGNYRPHCAKIVARTGRMAYAGTIVIIEKATVMATVHYSDNDIANSIDLRFAKGLPRNLYEIWYKVSKYGNYFDRNVNMIIDYHQTSISLIKCGCLSIK